jgi:hypothetical protein
MSENLNKVLGELEEDLKKLQSAREQVGTVVSHYLEFAKTVDEIVKNTQSHNKKTEEMIEDLATKANTALEEQKTENLKTLNQILETHNQIKQLIGFILDLELPGTLKNLNVNVQKIQEESNEQQKKLKTNQILMLAGFGIIIIILLVIQFKL